MVSRRPERAAVDDAGRGEQLFRDVSRATTRSAVTATKAPIAEVGDEANVPVELHARGPRRRRSARCELWAAKGSRSRAKRACSVWLAMYFSYEAARVDGVDDWHARSSRWHPPRRCQAPRPEESGWRSTSASARLQPAHHLRLAAGAIQKRTTRKHPRLSTACTRVHSMTMMRARGMLALHGERQVYADQAAGEPTLAPLKASAERRHGEQAMTRPRLRPRVHGLASSVCAMAKNASSRKAPPRTAAPARAVRAGAAKPPIRRLRRREQGKRCAAFGRQQPAALERRPAEQRARRVRGEQHAVSEPPSPCRDRARTPASALIGVATMKDAAREQLIE